MSDELLHELKAFLFVEVTLRIMTYFSKDQVIRLNDANAGNVNPNSALDTCCSSAANNRYNALDCSLK